MEDKVKICHFTSVHTRYDIRIFQKECVSLAKKYKVTLIVADNKGDELKDGIEIIDVGKDDSRLARIRKTPRRIYRILKKSDFAVYHFHDPELLPVGKKLIKRGKKVVYDVHEDVPRQILEKYWIPAMFRKMISRVFEKYENRVASQLSLVCTATPFIRDRFLQINSNTVDINNYPLLNELKLNFEITEKSDTICYIGGITRARGIKNIITAIENCNVQLILAGEYDNEGLKEEVSALPGWSKAIEKGFVSRQEVREIMKISKAGLVLFLPEPNHINAQPNKLFEYMSAELPVISSNFPLWKEIIEGNQCGFCVDPEDPKAIEEAINRVISGDIDLASKGKNGRKAVEEIYNWDIEEKKLYKHYFSLID